MQISPSILAGDFSRLAEEAKAMERAGADMLHLDVMDGHFVPNITFGPNLVKSLRPQCALPFDVHLMISDPFKYAPEFIDAGADIITFHLECDSDVGATLELIRAAGLRAGLALKPATPAQAVLPYLPLLDMVLVMTVEPGFGGQKFMADQMDKLAALRGEADKLGRPFMLQVDGGIDTGTAPIVAFHGANVLVAGSSLFRERDYAEAVSCLRRTAETALG